ncbi:MAG: endonuclease domain-containing protein [Archangium sp.]|nr:endonuclease domain-containing protein [Archangium sp.]
MRTSRINVERSRALRRAQTDAERRLWTAFRDGVSGYRFRRQHQIGPWIVDLACPSRRLVVEADGGGHAEPDTRSRDVRRDEWLRNHGWRVLRFWNFEVFCEFEAVIEVIFAALQVGPSPRPSPRFAGRGG